MKMTLKFSWPGWFVTSGRGYKHFLFICFTVVSKGTGKWYTMCLGPMMIGIKLRGKQ